MMLRAADIPPGWLNARGLRIAHQSWAIENFWRWFGDSKVVDKQGRPLVAHHGTTGDFSEFDPAKLGSSTKHPTASAGFFFSSSPTVAELFAGEKWSGWPLTRGFADGANVMPVYLAISNPVAITAREFVRMQRGSSEAFTAMVSKAKEDGHDGLRILGDTDLADSIGGDEYGADAWVALRPEQIKSATGNSGLFLLDSPDFTDSAAAADFLDDEELLRFGEAMAL